MADGGRTNENYQRIGNGCCVGGFRFVFKTRFTCVALDILEFVL